jgi:nucleoside-diphosphate-sugar epimerase
MRTLVTGAAVFIGCATCTRLLAGGADVVGLDAITDSYDPASKRANLVPLLEHDAFRLVEAELTTVPLGPLLDGVDTLIHLAALPGVRAWWGSHFADYERSKVLATQLLLEACRDAGLWRVSYASRSSVYGQAERFPAIEDILGKPVP